MPAKQAAKTKHVRAMLRYADRRWDYWRCSIIGDGSWPLRFEEKKKCCLEKNDEVMGLNNAWLIILENIFFDY